MTESFLAYAGIAMLVVIIGMVMIGFPVAFILGGIPFIVALFLLPPNFMNVFNFAAFDNLMTVYVFVASPLFIFMGAMLERSGVAEDLFKALYYLFGPLRGGLAISTVVIATLFGACTGTVGAGVITIGMLALPAMLSRNYSRELATGAIAVGGGLAVIIPPSVMFIFYGTESGVPIATLFAAGIIPGLMLSALYIAYIIIICRARPQFGPAIPDEERKKVTGRQLAGMIARTLLPPLFLIVAVLGSLFFGFAAPSEAAAVGALGSIVVAIAARKFNYRVLKEACFATMKIVAMVTLIVLGGKFFVAVFSTLGSDAVVRELLLATPGGAMGALLMSLFIILILGCFMDWVGIIYIMVPIVCPLMTQLGFPPLYFGILFCVVLQISNMTPPFAYSLFFIKSFAPPEVTTGDLFRGALPFVVLQVAAATLLIVFPKIVDWLPNLMGYK